MASGSGSTRRRPMGFFAPFNKWWSDFFNQNSRRPSKQDIETWRAENLSWRPELTVEDIVQHSKGRRDPEKNRLYFVEYRRKLKATARNTLRRNARKVRGLHEHATAAGDAYLKLGEDDHDAETSDEATQDDTKRQKASDLQESEALQARKSTFPAQTASCTSSPKHSHQPSSTSMSESDCEAAPGTGRHPGTSGCSSFVRDGSSLAPAVAGVMSTAAPTDSPPLAPTGLGSRPTSSCCAALTAALPIYIPLRRTRGPPRLIGPHRKLALDKEAGGDGKDGAANGHRCSHQAISKKVDSVPETGPSGVPAAGVKYGGCLASQQDAWSIGVLQTQQSTCPQGNGAARNTADPAWWNSARPWPCGSDEPHPSSHSQWISVPVATSNQPTTTTAAATPQLCGLGMELLRTCTSPADTQGKHRPLNTPSQRQAANNMLRAGSTNSVSGVLVARAGHGAISGKCILSPLLLAKNELGTLAAGMPGTQCDSPWSVLHCDGFSLGSGADGDCSGCDGSDSGSPTPAEADAACELTLSALQTSKRRPSDIALEGQPRAQQPRRAEPAGGLLEAAPGCPPPCPPLYTPAQPFTGPFNGAAGYVHSAFPPCDARPNPMKANQHQQLIVEVAAAPVGGQQQWAVRNQGQKPGGMSGSHGAQQLGPELWDPELEALDPSWLDSLLVDVDDLPADCFMQQAITSQQQYQQQHQQLQHQLQQQQQQHQQLQHQLQQQQQQHQQHQQLQHQQYQHQHQLLQHQQHQQQRAGPGPEPLVGAHHGLMKASCGGSGYGDIMDTLEEAWEAMLGEDSNGGAYGCGLGGWV